MVSILLFGFFVFGLVIGSFLNVVIYRHNTGKSFGGRSACMSCQNQLRFHELIPVISFIALRGRCKNCKTKISIQYPLVELTTGLIFALLFLKFQDVFFETTPIFVITYTYYAVLFSLLIIIAVYDLKHKIIPDTLSFIFGILAFSGLFLFSHSYNAPLFYPHFPSILEFLSGLLIASPFALLWLVSGGRLMGLGDAKLVIGLGWLLGFTLTFPAMMIAFPLGAIVGIILMLTSTKYKMKSEIPFAPYLILGAFLAFLFNLHFFIL